MTIRNLISFDHALLTASYALTVQTTYGANTLQSVFGQPGTIMTGNSSNGANILSNGWLSFASSNTTLYGGYVLSLADAGIFQGGATQAWLGFRIYSAATSASGNGACNVFGVLPSSAAGSLGAPSGANIIPLINETQLNRTIAGVAGAQYVEVFLDIGNNVYQTYVNGIQVSNGTLPVGFTHLVYCGQFFSGSAGQALRDFYFLDVDGTKPNGRLGPITSTPLTASVKNAPNYSNYNFSVSGGSSFTTAQSKFGGGSFGWSSGTNGVCTIPTNANLIAGASGDITYDCWINPNSATLTGDVFCKSSTSAPYAQLYLNAGVWNLYTDSAAAVLTANANLVPGTWYHIALVRYQGTWYLYQNGVLLGQIAGGTFGNNASNFLIGNSAAGNVAFQGYIDEFRVSNVARWTAAFTPPTTSAVVDANTMLLMRFDGLSGSLVADAGINQPSALAAAQGTSFAMTPFIQNGADNQAITLGFTPTVVTGQKVVAMQYKMAAQVPFAINLLSSLAMGANTKTLSPYLFRDTLANYGRDVAGMQTLAPDGTAWNAANIGNANLVLQPQSTTAGSTT